MINLITYKKEFEFYVVISLNDASSECTTDNYKVYDFRFEAKTKYADSKYIETKRNICEINESAFLLCYEKDMIIANRLLWECDNIKGILYVDINDPYKPERLVQSRDRILWNLQAGFSNESNKAFMSGWKNSYNNDLFSEAEIQEYVNDTRIKIAPYFDENSSILEIGCGSGMISDIVAPLVRKYDGVDISDGVLEKLRISNEERGINNMSLFNLAANEIYKIGKTYDVILSSSVTEYFSGCNYLRNVVCECIKCVNDGGVIFFGDVFDLDLREQYIDSVKKYQREHVDAKTSNSFMFELFISPRYWFDILNSIPEISSIEITRKIGVNYNEINRFRYDVLIHVNKQNRELNNNIKPYLFKYQFCASI